MSNGLAIARNAAVLCAILGLPGLAACASYDREVAPLDPAARDRIGQLRVTMGETAPASGFGPLPESGSRGMGAAAAAGTMLLGMTVEGAKDGPAGLIVGGTLGLVLAPFAAIFGAVTADQSVQPETRSANQQLVFAASQTDWSQQLRDVVRARLDGLGAEARTGLTTASHLGLWIEGPWLVIDGGDGIPAVTVHGQLMLDEVCALDRRWRWNGAAADFVALGESGAKSYKTQMSAGIAQLGNAIVSDLLVDQAPRKVQYRDERSAAAGALPLVAADPGAHQKQIGSWDKTPAEAALEPRCARLATLRQTIPQQPIPGTSPFSGPPQRGP